MGRHSKRRRPLRKEVVNCPLSSSSIPVEKSGLAKLFSIQNLSASTQSREKSLQLRSLEESIAKDSLRTRVQKLTSRCSILPERLSDWSTDAIEISRSIFLEMGLVLLTDCDQRLFGGDCEGVKQFCTINSKLLELEGTVCKRLENLNILYQYDQTIENAKFTDKYTSKKRRRESLENRIVYENKNNFKFFEVSSRCNGRLDIRINRDDDVLSQLVDPASPSPWLDCVKSILGSDAELRYFGLIISFPGSSNQRWHGDGPHLFGDELQCPAHAVNVFIPLDDITEELGPTEFIPSSHLLTYAAKIDKVLQVYSDLDGSMGTLDVAKICDTRAGCLPIRPLPTRGSSLIYDYRVLHRGTANTSTSCRRMLYLLYTKPWFTDTINFGKCSIFAPDEEVLRSYHDGLEE